MATEVSTNQLLHGYSRFLHRYNVVIFVVVALGGLALVVFMLNQTIQVSADTTAATETPIAGFDQATIERLNGLKQTSSSEALKFPAGRINPFIE